MFQTVKRFIPILKSSRSILDSIPVFQFSSIKLSNNKIYPYVFNGLTNVAFRRSQVVYQTLKQIFEQNTIDGFKQAYKFTLYSLAQKDLKNLENICQPNLIKNLQFRNVQLINPDADIQAVTVSSFKAFGAQFVRSQTSQLKLVNNEHDNKFYLNIGLMGPSGGSAQLMKYATNGLPILMAYQVLFKSSMKLVPQQNKKAQNNAQQIHSIQFQVQGKINMMKYMKLAMNMASGGMNNSNVKYDQAKSILKQMMGNDYEWKIGDIDRVLKGNVKVVG